MAARLVRIQRELEEIARLADEEEGAREQSRAVSSPSHGRR